MPTEGDVIEQKAAEIGRLFMLHVLQSICGSMEDRWPVCRSIFQSHLLADSVPVR
jgi:hypothetical protein